MLIRKGIAAALAVSILGLCSVIFAADVMAPDSDVAVLTTNFGNIVIEFYPNAAPNTVRNFKKLARSGFYDGTKFHRVIKGFMIQGGDPNSKDNDKTNDGTGDAGYKIPAEFTAIPHERGILSMARSADPDSASCQFFIMHGKAEHLNGKYTVFGHVIDGMKVVDKITMVKVDSKDNPISPVVIKKITIEKRSTQSAPAQ